jgi:hypothetical protein
LCGFIVSAQFVSLEALEIPYYTALLGCGALKLSTARYEELLWGREPDPNGFVSHGYSPVMAAV